MTKTKRIGLPEARRIGLAAQGFVEPWPEPGQATMRQVQRVIDRVGVVQIDSVNVLTRSHYLPFFSRLGPYDTDLLDRARDRSPRRVVEYWAHEASLIPPATWPLLTFRMQRARQESWGRMQRVARDYPDLVKSVLAEVRSHGPLTSREIERRLEHDGPRNRDDWGWNWSLVKSALEHLFWTGQIGSAGRSSQFERRYDALERVMPKPLRHLINVEQRPSAQQAHVELLRIAARAHGIGTERCLRDYFRLSSAQARPALRTLVETGELQPVTIEGWKRPAYLHVQARRPRAVHARALLSPFDSLIWQRERTAALWDFHYRLEIYVPRHKRVHGYYVLPFLFGDRLVARVDLKADRAAGVLRVHATHWEDKAPGAARPALDEELMSLAGWLGLEQGVVHGG